MISKIFDLIPVVLFFSAYKCWDIYAATLAIMLALTAQILFLKLRHEIIKAPRWITFVIVLILGSITLLLRNEIFIKWKPTIVYGFFAMSILGYQWFCGKCVMQKLMGDKITLQNEQWKVLNYSWAVFFSVMAALNLVVVFLCSTNTWVNFKVFGILGSTILFGALQTWYLSRYLKE